MFNINFNQLINDLLPHFLRKEKILSWIQVILKPATLLYQSFLDFRASKLYEAKITGQVISLEKMLNDEFYDEQSGMRKIYITDSEDEDADVLLYNTTEPESETWIYNKAEVAETDTLIYSSVEGQSSYDFIVNVDVALDFDMDLMISLINKYKLAGTTYQIIILQ